jgi:hypothetical protein
MRRIFITALLLFAGPALAQDDPLDDLPEPDISGTEEEELLGDLADETPVSEEDAPDDDDDLMLDDDDLMLDDDDLMLDDEPPEDLDGSFVDQQEEDLFDENTDAQPRAAGEDTVDLYRDQLRELEGADAEEVLSAWEAYLVEWPNTLYRDQIARTIGEAEIEMYGDGISTDEADRPPHRGMKFPEPASGENLNPASRIKFGFEWGLPTWINLMGDAELALSPRFSGHASMRKRYQGWSFELGPRFAMVKDEGTGTLVTLAGDAHLGIDPAIIGLRPTLGAGQRFFDRAYLQVQVSPEWQLIQGYWTFYGAAGANLTLRASDSVAFFLEGNMASQYLGWPGGALQFHTIGFGMRFYPTPKGRPVEDKTEVLFGAQVPMSWSYWDFHKGAASVQSNLYLD